MRAALLCLALVACGSEDPFPFTGTWDVDQAASNDCVLSTGLVQVELSASSGKLLMSSGLVVAGRVEYYDLTKRARLFVAFQELDPDDDGVSVVLEEHPTFEIAKDDADTIVVPQGHPLDVFTMPPSVACGAQLVLRRH